MYVCLILSRDKIEHTHTQTEKKTEAEWPGQLDCVTELRLAVSLPCCLASNHNKKSKKSRISEKV